MTAGPPKEPIKYVEKQLHLPYCYVAGDYKVRYLAALKDKQILDEMYARGTAPWELWKAPGRSGAPPGSPAPRPMDTVPHVGQAASARR